MIPASVPTEISSLDDVPSDWPYYVEPKYDGHRVIIDYRDDEPRIYNRKGTPYSARRFELKLAPWLKGCVVDAEYMFKPPKGSERWDDVEWPHIRMFDILWYNGASCIGDDLITRMAALRFIHQRYLGHCLAPRFGRESTSEQSAEDVVSPLNMKYWRANPTIDGIVIKNAISPYIPGRTESWLKFKFTSDLDAIVTDLNIDSKSNCELSVMEPSSGKVWPIGRASTAGKKIARGDVVKVRFLTFHTDSCRLREPRIIEVREDKDPVSCTIDQLIPFLEKETHKQ